MNGTGQWQAAYLDVGQGVGIADGGRRLSCRPGARLGEVLAAVPEGVQRLYLCGELPHLRSVVRDDDHYAAAVRGDDRDDDAADRDAADSDGGDDAGDEEDDNVGGWDDPVAAGGTPSRYLQWCLDHPSMVCPDWQPDPVSSHHLDTSHAASCVLRFRHTADGRQLEVCSIGGWVGDALGASCTPADARDALTWLTVHIAYAFDGAALLGSAGQNGLHTWRHCAERPGQDGRPLLDRYPVLPEDLRALLHHTSGQARIERFLPTAPGHAALLPRLSHYDGRLMYAASMSGLGVGPVTHDNLPDFAPYRPAWYRVRFTVPRDWRHPGVLGVQVPGIRRTWEWPAEPGHTGET
jgi:hypothetical protein